MDLTPSPVMHDHAILNESRGEYRLTTDKRLMDLDAIHAFLRESYWSPGVPRETVARAIEHSEAFAILRGSSLAGFARVVTDYATFAYLADVFVLPEHRGNGLSKWMMQAIVSHPPLQGLRRWMLATRDAHGLYEQFGFTPLSAPDRFMERWNPLVYRDGG